MAGASLLTLIDNIATLLDDVAVMTKAAAKKTAGVLGDDLTLNAQQVAGVSADRELPVVCGSQGFGHKQADPRANSARHQRPCLLGDDAAAHAGWRLPLL